MDCVIVGGGVAGLSCGYDLSWNGTDVRVLEKEDYLGGLSMSIRRGPHTVDLGPHRFYSNKDHLVRHFRELLGGDVVTSTKTSRILMNGSFLHFPIKLGEVLTQLPLDVKLRIFRDYLTTKTTNLFSKKPDDSFESWIRNRFGDTLYRLFFGDYTEKTWGIPCNRISVDWAEQRIGVLSITDAVRKAVIKPKDAVGDAVRVFYYPRTGGAGVLSERYADGIRAKGGQIQLNSTLKRIRHKDGNVTSINYETPEGVREESEFDYLLPTIPVTEVVGMLDPAPPQEVVSAAEKLLYRACAFVFLVVDKPKLTCDHWIYLPGREFTANRITEFKNYSKENSTPEQTVVSLEITCDFGDGVWNAGDAELIQLGKKDLVTADLAIESEITDAFVHKASHCYPLYTLDYREKLDIINNYLRSIRNLRVFGRNGVFVSNNMDHSMDLGFKVAESILGRDTDVKRLLGEQVWEK